MSEADIERLRSEEYRMAKKKARDGIYVKQRMLVFTARQFLPKIQGQDEWPVGVRFAVPGDKVGKERYVIGEPAHSVVHSGDWVLINRSGDAIVCANSNFPHEYEECDCV